MLSKINFVLIFVVILHIEFYACDIVATEYGRVQGRLRETEKGTKYFSFQAIPYAKAPDGNLRFRDLEPPHPWNDTLDCTKEGPPFWGQSGGQIRGSFDSMHINIFTKDVENEKKLPVVVMIHGGAYHSGSSSPDRYGHDYFIERDVVFVTFNYRLGAFGFLSLDDEKLGIPGNAAFKDQRMALKWIQRNIENFGGDSQQITLIGHSAGGSSTHYHMISENSRSLFNRAISMGGNVLQNVANYIPRLNWAQRLASRLGFNSSSEEEILEFLVKADPVDIVQEQLQLVPLEASLTLGFNIAFGPTREPYVTEGVFLYKDLSDHLEDAWGNEIDYIIGQTSMENLFLVPLFRSNPQILTLLDFQVFIPRELGLELNTEESMKYGKIIQDFYYPVFDPTITNIDGVLFASSDCDLWYPTYRSIRYRLLSQKPSKTFVYRFDASTENNFNSALTPGAQLYRYPTHGDDANQIFKTIRHKNLDEMDDRSSKVIALMVDSFTNFAKTGDPSVREFNVTWTPVDHEHNLLRGLNIHEEESSVVDFPESKRMAVYEKIWSEIRRKYN